MKHLLNSGEAKLRDEQANRRAKSRNELVKVERLESRQPQKVESIVQSITKVMTRLLIIAAIGVYIGVGLIPGMQSTISGITTAAGYQTGVVGMVAVILIVFAAMIFEKMVSPESNFRMIFPLNGEHLKQKCHGNAVLNQFFSFQAGVA